MSSWQICCSGSPFRRMRLSAQPTGCFNTFVPSPLQTMSDAVQTIQIYRGKLEPISAIYFKGFWILSIFTIFHDFLKKVPIFCFFKIFLHVTFSITNLTLRESIIFLMSHMNCSIWQTRLGIISLYIVNFNFQGQMGFQKRSSLRKCDLLTSKTRFDLRGQSSYMGMCGIYGKLETC